MAQTYKYTIEGNTQPAVDSNEALDKSINKIDTSTKQLQKDTDDLKKKQKEQADAAQKAFNTQLENKIKSTDALIKGVGGTVNLLTGTLSTAIGTLGLFGIEDEQIESFQKTALSVLALSTGITQQLTGLKDVTEAQKLQNEVTQSNLELTKASTTAENINTTALNTNKDAVKGVTAAFQQSALSIAVENAEVAGNTGLRGANAASTGAATSSTIANTVATYLNVAAQKALNLAIKANPYLALASILISVGTLLYGVTKALFGNTEAEEDNTKAKELNAEAIKAQEEATKALARTRNLSDVEAAKQAVRQARADKAGAEARLARATAENRFSEATQQARIDAINANTALINAEQDLLEAKKKAGEQAARDKKEQDAKNKLLRDERLEREGIVQLIKLEGEELIDALIYKDRPWWEWTEVWVGKYKDLKEELGDVVITLKRVGEPVDLRNLKDLETTIEGIGLALEEIDFNEFEDNIAFLSREQLDILKRLRGELDTELKQQLFDREQTYYQELALFADNEEAKTALTEEYEKDRAKIRRQYALQTAQDIIGITSNFLNVIADINQQSLELQLAQAAGNQQAIDAINKKALKTQKQLRTAQTLVTTAESILNGFNATSTLPPPFNFIAGGILAAAYSALGAKTIQTINAVSLEGGGSAGGFNNIPGGGAAFGSINLGGGATAPTSPYPTGILPGIGGGRLGGPAGIGETQMPVRAYVLAGDIENGVAANAALNNRRRLAG